MPPSQPIRDKIVDQLCDTLAALTAGASYWYTPAQVYRWSMAEPEVMSFPSYCVTDLDETVARSTTPLAHRTLSITVQGVHMASSTDDPSAVARRLLADIQKAVQVDRTRGGYAVTTNEVGNRVFVAGPTEPLVVCEVDLEVTYRTALGDPATTAP